MGDALIISTKPLVAKDYAIGDILHPAEKTEVVVFSCSRFYPDNGYHESRRCEVDAGGYIYDAYLFWSSVDVYYEDGTLALSASEPIPVYEPAQNDLVSADGYTLVDVNDTKIIPKEDDTNE